MNELTSSFHLQISALGHLTSAVQLGFISGTLLFAILTIADRFSPSRVFLVCALFGALLNLGVTWSGNTLGSLLTLRFLTGFFLAGIYPVGMKIAADHFEKGLGKSLGFLVGALVLGTAFPHIMKEMTASISWKAVLYGTSILAASGGIMMALLVPDGPYRKPAKAANLSAFFKVFSDRSFRSPAFGYFGHMWELYAFWAFVPLMLKTYTSLHPQTLINIPLWSFVTIGIGSVGCILAGYLSQTYGARRIAFLALSLSCFCCLISPLLFVSNSVTLFIAFLLFWGIVVIADSPLFSTLVAQNAPSQIKGTALTIVNSVGFAITIISIQLMTSLNETSQPQAIYIWLSIGPIFGLVSLARGRNRTATDS